MVSSIQLPRLPTALGIRFRVLLLPSWIWQDRWGIFRANGRLGFWDSANSVSWSSLFSFIDFTPSLETLAGFATFNDVLGRIVTIKASGSGFIIYSTKISWSFLQWHQAFFSPQRQLQKLPAFGLPSRSAQGGRYGEVRIYEYRDQAYLSGFKIEAIFLAYMISWKRVRNRFIWIFWMEDIFPEPYQSRLYQWKSKFQDSIP